MNAIGMLFHQVQPPNRLPDDTEGQKANLSAFHGLLVKEQTEADNEISSDEKQRIDEEMIDHGELLHHLFMGFEEMQQDELIKDETLEKLVNYLIAETDNDAIEVDADQLAPKLATLLEQWTTLENKYSHEENGINAPLLGDLQDDPVTLKETVNEQQFAEILQKVEILLTQISTERDAVKTAPKLLTLLEQWTVLEKKYSNENNIMDSQAIRNESSTKEHSIWKALLDVYQKRQQFVTQQRYNSDAEVTSTDVAKWIHKALNENTLVDKPSGNHSLSFASLPMSRVEQYVIHINQTHTQGSYSAEEQLMEQLQKVMKASRFLTMPNGTSQLSINLRPDNLGEMMVRLTQVNGEMTVKIIVTSHATKELLQSNIHQLKNMFSPQQVIIERQELNTDLNQELNEEQDEQPMKEDQDQNGSDHPEQHEKSRDDDLETKFHDLLMNEKV